MNTITIRVTDGDLKILKSEAAKQQYDLDEYLDRFFSEKMRPIRGEYAKREREENAKKYASGWRGL